MSFRTHQYFAAQHGLITFGQSAEAGLRIEQVRRLVAAGDWVRIRPGIYAEGDHWRSLDRWIGQPALRARAAHLVLTIPRHFSHASAVALHGFSLFDHRDETVHVTRPDMRGRRSRAGITQHGARTHPRELQELRGLPVLSLARTALDVAREHGHLQGLVACDHALRRGVSRAELAEAAERMQGWPYVTRVRECVALADAGAANPAESAARALVLELGIGVPETQFGLSDGNTTVWCDLRVGRHVFEFDGWVKYRGIENGGLAADGWETLRAEKRRQDFIGGFKLGVSRIGPDDLVRDRAAALRRLAREFASTQARFGAGIHDLSPYIVRRR